MRSIRRTLILNLTVLLLGTLVAIGVLVYRTTSQAIEEKRKTAREKVELQFADQRDESLLAQARIVSSEAQSLFDPIKFRQQSILAPLSLLTPPMGPYGQFQIPLWLGERVPSPFASRLLMTLATELTVNDLQAAEHGYIQINSDWGTSWRSSELEGRSLAFDPNQFNNGNSRSPSASGPPGNPQRVDWGTLDDVEIRPGITARRVRLKAPLVRFRMSDPVPEFPQVIRAGVGIGSHVVKEPVTPDPLTNLARTFRSIGNLRGPPPRFFIYVQCAWDPTTEHPRLIELTTRRNQQLEEIDADTTRTLHSLRNVLLMIGSVSLAGVVLGGWLVVGLGLHPLRRLSIAVSQVSAKDFRLPIDSQDLPREVVPVVERLRVTLAALQNAFAREKRAAADISHELRTPLAALTTTLEVALRKPRSSEEYRNTLEDSREIARQISLLVERMLVLAWLDAGTDVVRTQRVEVSQLVRGCAAIGKPLAEAQGLQFQVRAGENVMLQSDPDKMREVLMNLMHNAIEYNQPGGSVELAAETGATGGIVLEVRDTGIGIPPELQEKIFERFYRGDPSRNAVGVHAGLGLAIVKEYVDRLGGSLAIESEVGLGTRFRVTLPNL